MRKRPSITSTLALALVRLKVRLTGRAARLAALSAIVALASAAFYSSSFAASVGRLLHVTSLNPAAASTSSPAAQGPATKGAGASAPVSPSMVAAAVNSSGTLTVPRAGHTATRLDNGNVLIAGGDDGGTVEIFDAGAGTFSYVGTLSVARRDHTAVKLAGGRVLIAGGSVGGSAVASTETYDAATGTLSAGPDMGAARAGQSATVLSDGRVLITGGDEGGSAEIYDPAANSFSPAGAGMTVARSGHSSVLLQDGRVLIVGGRDAAGNELSSGEVFDPAQPGFTAVGSMKDARVRPLLRVLTDGKVQIIGGTDHESIEIYDPANNIFGAHAHVYPLGDDHPELIQQILSSPSRAALFHPGATDPLVDRAGQTITELPQTNRALVAGGTNGSGTTLGSAAVLDSSPASVTTDKLDYAPGTTVVITGKGWQPNENVVLTLHEDPHVVTENPHAFSVQADADGNFVFQEYAPEDADSGITYILAAVGQSSSWTAQTTFTDTPLPSSVKLQQWETLPTPGSWITGNLGSGNSDYKEGETVPFRLDVGGLATSGNPYTFSVCRDYDNGPQRGYLFLAPFNTSRAATPGGTITSTNGPFSGVNVTITSFVEVGGQGGCNAGQRETKVTINSTGTSTAFVLWGGHLASPIEAGVGQGNGAGSFPGSSLHMTLLTPSKSLSINPGAIIKLATITVQKVVDFGSASPSNWCFNISPNPNGETLPKCPAPGGDTVTFLSLPTGSYQVTETTFPNYGFVSGSGTNCTFSGSTATANVSTGTTPTDATCTFHNALPKLIVIKHVINDSGGTATAANFTMSVTGGSPSPASFPGAESPGTTVAINTAGAYSVSEAGPTGYSSTFSSDCAGTIAGGETKTCTVTNDDKPGTLIVKKHVVNDNGGTKVAGDFTMSVTGTNVQPGATFAGSEAGTTVTLNAGSYSVDEAAVGGYTKTLGAACSGTIANGETKTCTMTNDDQAPQLTLNKVVVNDNGGTAAESAWTLTADGGAAGTLSGPGATGNADVVSGATLKAGTYSLSESSATVTSGYTASQWSCVKNGGAPAQGNSITLGLGDSAVCTITNNDVAPTLKLVKTVVNDNGGTLQVTDFPLFINGNAVTSGQVNTLSANVQYTASETNKPGYTPSAWGGDCAADGKITLQPGDNKTCTITNDDQPGTLVVKKVVVNDNGGTKAASDFSFQVNGGAATAFQQDGDALHGKNSVSVNAGSYSVIEPASSGYTTSYDGCSGTITNGETKTCTITNDDQAAHLIIVKQVINNNGGGKGAGDFSGTITGVTASGGNGWTGTASPGVDKALTSVGSYSVTEGAHAGYDVSYSTDCAGTIALGQTKTCTVTNDDVQPKLTVTKVVVNDNGGTKVVADFPLNVSGSAVTSGTQNGFNAGSYTVGEANQAGYAASFSGDCAADGSVTLAVGDVKQCTITNDDIAPKLTVTKIVVNDNGGTKNVSDFPLFVDSGSVISGQQGTFTAGAHTVSEAGDAAYAAAIGGDCASDGSITLNPGDVKSCTITNDDRAATLVVKKHVVNDNGGTKVAGDFSLTVTGTNVQPSATFAGNEAGTTVTLDAGSYSVDELAVGGYVKTLGTDCSGTIANGETKTCTVTNDDQAASLTLVKEVINNNGGARTTSEWTLTATGTGSSPTNLSGAGGASSDATFKADTYTLGESGPTDYTASAYSCVKNGGPVVSSNSITLGNGDTATCTITNDDKAATLTVIKHVVNNNGGSRAAGDFTINVTGGAASPASFQGNESGTSVTLNAGSYSVDEVELGGYTKSLSVDCSGTIANGEAKTCTVTNDDQPGTLIVKKVVENDPNPAATHYSFTVNEAGPESFEADPDGNPAHGTKTVTVSAGAYNVVEVAASGYTTTYSADCSGAIANGETKSCTITNTKQTPSIAVAKTASPSSYSTVGEVITYNYTVTNTGNVTLSNVTLSDDQLGAVGGCAAATLMPGASTTCAATHAITQADLDNGSVTNVATAAGSFNNQTYTGTDSKTVTAQQNRALALAKSASPTNYSSVGTVITYTYTITNTGNVTLAGPFSVADDKQGTISPCGSGPLAPNATTSCTSTHTITQPDIDNGSITNKATASGNGTTSNEAEATVTAQQNRALTLVKSASPTSYDHVGQTVSYSYTVTNTGNVTLSGPFTVTDDKATVTCPALSPNMLAPGASTTCSSSYAITQADLDGGSVTNHATATNGTTTSPEATATVTADQNRALTLMKSADPATYNAVSQTITYTYTITNTGNVTLAGPFSVSDDHIGSPLGTSFACGSGPLAPQATTSCTASYSITQGDLDAGHLTNKATASGNGVTSNEATATVTAQQNPALTLVKSASPTSYSSVGQTISYSYLVTNSGNVTLSGPFSVSDDKAAASCPATASLAPGASVTCGASYTITQTDLDNGSVTNVASASNGTTTSPTDAKTVSAAQHPALSLTKSASPTSYDHVGELITYTYTVTNTGNVTLAGPVTATDNKATVTCPADGLAPGASITCTASYAITQADLDDGSVTNTAVASTSFGGNAVNSNEATATVTANQSRTLSLAKSASPASYSSVGAVITYTYTITNTGNVTLGGPFSVADDKQGVISPCGSGPLAPGASTSCGSTHTITQQDIDDGSITNTATASGNAVTSNQASVTVTASQTKTMTVAKSSTTTSLSAPGTVTYTYVVTNTGNVTLTGIGLVDDNASAVTCAATTLAPAATTTCTAAHDFTQAELDANGSPTAGSGSLHNNVTASSAQGATASASLSIPISQTRALSLTKTADPTTYDHVGQAITYSYTVKNTGNVTLSGPFSVTDDKATATCPALTPNSLAPGAETTCTASYTVDQGDLDGGHVTNVASASNGTLTSPTDTVTVNATQSPALSLVKSASPASYSAVGDAITYSYTISNTGNVTLAGPFSVTDDRQGTISPCGSGPLAPGASTGCTSTHTITQADLDAGSITNKASASGNGTTSNEATATVTATQTPSLSLAKSASPATYSATGQVISYSYALTNSGNVTLAGPFTITDNRTSDEGCPATSGLAPGASITCTASYSITQADLDAGSVTNTAEGHGFFGSASVTSNTAMATVTANQTRKLTMVKSATPSTYSAVGDIINYSYSLTNDGNVTLSGPFTVADNKATVTCPASPSSLAPSASTTCTASYTITQADLDSGSVTNKATATNGTTASNQAQATVNAVQTPALSIKKTADNPTYSHVGDVITYSYLVKNVGNVTLSGPFTVSDDKTTNELCPATPTSLAPGDSLTCSSSYTVMQADLDGGSVTNIASASNGTVTSNADTVTINAIQTRSVSLDKTASPTTYSTVGSVISYSYLVTNTGNVTLAGPVTVTDDKASVNCPAVGLAPGASTTCTASYTITQPDLDGGSVTNTAKAKVNDVFSNEDSETVNAIRNPALDLLKEAAAHFSAPAKAGDTIAYSFSIKNTGNVTLGGVEITDALVGYANAACGASSLAPGQTTTCSAQYTLLQSDVDAGHVSNSATACSGATCDTETTDTPVPAAASIAVAKTANPASYSAVGQTISYGYTVTNTGNVTLSNVTLSDDQLGAVGGCAAATLMPGASTTCAATHAITQADLDNGSVTNVATATGSFNNQTYTGTDSKKVTANQNPNQAVDKALASYNDADGNGKVSLGDTLHYTVTATNTGNVTLTNVVVSDSLTSTSNTCASVAPGQTCVLMAAWVVNQADVDHGNVHNVGTADSDQTTPTEDQNDVPVPQSPALSLAKSASPTTYSAVGAVITYNYTVKNTGNVTLDGPFTVSDDKATVSCAQPGSLAPGVSLACTATYTITQADLDANHVTNVASGKGSFGGNAVSSNQATATVNAVQSPALTIDKRAQETTYSHVGDLIHYSYVVTNTGNVTLAGPFSVTDDKTSVSCPATPTSLAPNGSLTCTATYTVTQGDLDAGSVTNVARASNGTVTSPPDSETVHATQTPHLSLTKGANPTTYDHVGQAISYTLVATNDGNVTLSGVSISDPTLGSLVCSGSTTLAPGGSLTCTASYTIKQSDLDAGSVHNHATATNGNGVNAEADASVNAVQTKALSLTKSATPSTYSAVGQVISYSYVLKNTGNVTLNGPFTVTDDKATVTCPASPSSLAPSASTTCTASYTITQADLDSGSVTNKATATNGTTTSNQAQATVNAVQTKSLSLTKTAAPLTYSAVGQLITYTYVLKNTGNVTLAGPFSVADDKQGTISPCGSGPLAPNASTSCTSTHTITQADLVAGSITNKATASGNGATSNEATATVTAQHPALSVTKTADAATVNAGAPIGFTITVNNGGPATAVNVTLSDTLPTGNGIIWTESPDNPNCTITGNSLGCNFGDLPAGQSVSVHVSSPTGATACGTYNNTATAQASNNAPVTSAKASTTVLCTGKGKVTGGGQVVPAQGGTASFGYIAQRKTDGGPASGHFNYVNHTTGLHINGPVNDLVILSPTSARFSGTWDTGCTFTVYMEDNGEPGVSNGDRLEVSYSCSAQPTSTDAPNQVLLHGNNQMHKAGANSPPVANADTVTTAEKAAVNINVLPNDIPGPVEDAGQTLTVTAVGAPANGTAVLNADNSITYAPIGYFNGTDGFNYTVCDNGTTDGVADPQCATGTVTVTVTAMNDVPAVGTINAPADAVKAGTAINTFSASFTDPDVSDTHTATWNWGDGGSSAGTVTETNGSVTGSHTYTAAGLYTVTLTVTDKGGLSGSSVFKSVTVYNSTGTITGSGQFNSPVGAYPSSRLLAGSATFTSVNVKYATGATVPSGTTSFIYSPAGLTFTATSFNWLVTSGGKAWYRGTGSVTINGVSQSCQFLVAALDGPSSTTDKFRIKLWTTTAVLYDDQMGDPQEAAATVVATTGPGSVAVK